MILWMGILVCAQSVKIFALDVHAHQKASIIEEVLTNQVVRITKTLASFGTTGT